jgi:hypothetical protein
MSDGVGKVEYAAVVCHHDYCPARTYGNFGKQLHHGTPGGRIQRRCRFVADEKSRFVN